MAKPLQLLKPMEAAKALGMTRHQFYRFRKKWNIPVVLVPETRIHPSWVPEMRRLKKKKGTGS